MPPDDPSLTRCPGCGALVPDEVGPTHAYLGAAPGCWALYGEVLAREYGDVRYARLHNLTVDAYAAQHPGDPSPQTIRSVAVHLISLRAVFETGLEAWLTAGLKQKAATRAEHFVWLEPPADRGATTVIDVHAVDGPAEHAAQVRRWAEAVWEAWEPHHDTIRRWGETVG